MTLPAWADRRKRQEPALEDLFAKGPAADWASHATQPVSALVRPAAPDDDESPLTEVTSVEDLDTLAKKFVR
jgi:hypothetical protein